MPSPKIDYDFGLAYVGLGRTADALAAFERFLAEAPDAPPDTREKAASSIPTLRARLAEAARAAKRRQGAGGGAAARRCAGRDFRTSAGGGVAAAGGEGGSRADRER